MVRGFTKKKITVLDGVALNNAGLDSEDLRVIKSHQRKISLSNTEKEYLDDLYGFTENVTNLLLELRDIKCLESDYIGKIDSAISDAKNLMTIHVDDLGRGYIITKES